MSQSDSTIAISQSGSTTQDMFAENMRIMTHIVDQMREENPDLKELRNSEKRGDNVALTKVIFPDYGGVHTWMEKQVYPFKGFPFYELVDKLEVLKKLSRAFLSGIWHTFKKKKVKLVLLLPLIFFVGDLSRVVFYVFHRYMYRYRLKPLRYCDSVRELYRVFSIELIGEKEEMKELRIMVRDLLCMFLEFDNAYRFRFQDVILGMNSDNARKNPIKEIQKLLDILSAREKTQEIKDTWFLINKFLPVYLWFHKDLKEIIKNALYQINPEKVALDVADKSYCIKRDDYHFDFCGKQGYLCSQCQNKIIKNMVLEDKIQKEQEKLGAIMANLDVILKEKQKVEARIEVFKELKEEISKEK